MWVKPKAAWGAAHENLGSHHRRFQRIIAHVLVEPRSPGGAHGVARLEQGSLPSRGTTAHHAEVATAQAGEQFHDGIALAVPPHSQHDALVGPFHGTVRPALNFGKKRDTFALACHSG